MNRLTISGFADEIDPRLDVQLQVLSRLGVKYVELRSADGINVSDFTKEKTKEVKEKLEAAGVQVSSIGSPIGKIGIHDPFQPHMEKLRRTLEVQKELGAPYLRLFSFYLPKGEDPENFRNEVWDRMGAMAEEAKRWDSVLLHENEKEIFGDNAHRCKALMESFYGPNFKAVFDFANFLEVGQETLPAYQALKPYIAYIHIKDVDPKQKKVVPAGAGEGHIKEILSDLLAGGWKGFLSLEPHLVDFAGIAALEQNAQKRNSAMTGETAWETAHNALIAILRDIPQAKEALQ